MRKREKIFLAVAAVIAVGAFVGIRLQGADGKMAPGTNIAGVDVGEQSLSEAKQKVRREAHWAGLKVRVAENKTTLSGLSPKPEAARAVREALRESENRSLPEKLFTGGGGDYSLEWDYSEAALAEGLKSISEEVNNPPVNAQVIYKGGGAIRVVPGRMGMEIPYKESLKKLQAVARSGGGTVALQRKRSRPQALNRKEAPKIYPELLVVDRAARTLYFYKNLRLKNSYSVAVGMPGFETPTGRFRIQEKSVDPVWVPPAWAGSIAGQVIPGGTPENPLIDRWMGVADGVGLHGTSDLYSLGSAASHGCIRMDPADIIPLYEQIPVGTPIIIAR